MYNINTLINNINTLINEKQISKAEFYKEAEISQGNFSDWKRGRSKPSEKTLSKLAKYFNCTIDYLLGIEEKQNQQSEEEKLLFELFNKLSDERKARSISYLTKLVTAQEKGEFTLDEIEEMTNPANQKYTYIAAFGEGVQEIEHNENIEESIRESFPELYEEDDF